MATLFVASFTGDLIGWFGPSGMLSLDTLFQLTGAGEQQMYRFSFFYLTESPMVLGILHCLSLAILVAYTLGVFSRVTSILAFLIVLSYVHRAPMLSLQFEPLLTMLLAYLCLAPTGAYASVDHWLKTKKLAASGNEVDSSHDRSLSTTIAVRLIQVHFVGIYAVVGLTQLNGTSWWGGEAIWTLISDTDHRLIDLTFLSNNPAFAINLLTQAIILFELAYPILVWNRLARPLLFAISILIWTLIGSITGLVFYSVMMMLLNFAFVEGAWARQRLACCSGEPKPAVEA